jgi:hypothetical protein
MAYAANTTVAPEKSRAEIERTLRRYGADAFSYGYEGCAHLHSLPLASRSS